jgi:hypothetical protein
LEPPEETDSANLQTPEMSGNRRKSEAQNTDSPNLEGREISGIHCLKSGASCTVVLRRRTTEG